MGQFTIVVHGTGAHHNWASTDEGPNKAGFLLGRRNDYDADLLFSEFVELLKSKGHTITGATFTVGGMEGADNIIPRDFINPRLAPIDEPNFDDRLKALPYERAAKLRRDARDCDNGPLIQRLDSLGIAVDA